MQTLKIGQIVVNKRGCLRSGAEAYDSAVVVNLKPLQLMSIEGDMFWSGSYHNCEDEFVVIESNFGGYLPDAVVERMKREGLEVPAYAVNPEKPLIWEFTVVYEGDLEFTGSGTVSARTVGMAEKVIRNRFPKCTITQIRKRTAYSGLINK